MEWTRKHQNLTGARLNFVFRSSMNKAEQDMPVRRKSNASEGVKRENLFSRLTEETSQPESTEATQSLKAARCQQTSVSNSRTKARARTLPWKWNNNQRQVLTQPATSSSQTIESLSTSRSWGHGQQAEVVGTGFELLRMSSGSWTEVADVRTPPLRLLLEREFHLPVSLM